MKSVPSTALRLRNTVALFSSSVRVVQPRYVTVWRTTCSSSTSRLQQYSLQLEYDLISDISIMGLVYNMILSSSQIFNKSHVPSMGFGFQRMHFSALRQYYTLQCTWKEVDTKWECYSYSYYCEYLYTCTWFCIALDFIR